MRRFITTDRKAALPFRFIFYLGKTYFFFFILQVQSKNIQMPEVKEIKELKVKKIKSVAKDEKKQKKRKLDENGNEIIKKKKKVVVEEEEEKVVQVQEEESPLAFSNFSIQKSTIQALEARGITSLFPIQAATFTQIVSGKDLLGRARTGTGKTLAFALPIIEILKQKKKADPASFSKRGRSPSVLVMAPTRELANQVAKEFVSIASDLSCLCVYGGVEMYPQSISI